MRHQIGSSLSDLSGATAADLEGLHAEVEFERVMTKRSKVGDQVTWNSEAGRVGGEIIKVHTKDAEGEML